MDGIGVEWRILVFVEIFDVTYSGMCMMLLFAGVVGSRVEDGGVGRLMSGREVGDR
jgi:hypothetical protein